MPVFCIYVVFPVKRQKVERKTTDIIVLCRGITKLIGGLKIIPFHNPISWGKFLRADISSLVCLSIDSNITVIEFF